MADPVGQPSTQTESLAPWVAPYVTNMLNKGQALSNTPYQAYTGPLTAGTSGLQNQAFQGIAGLTVPTAQMGASGFAPQSFTDAGVAQQYMNPYLSASLAPQLQEAQRQAELRRIADASRLSKAGAYGGSRQAIMESEGNRNLLQNLAGITGTGYNTAFNEAQRQFNLEQGQRTTAQDMTNRYGLTALQQQADMGATQRGVEAEGVAADYAQFKDERDDPFKKVQYQQSLLQGLPVQSEATTYIEPSNLSELMGYGLTLAQIANLFKKKT